MTQCDHCGAHAVRYHWCRNRHCPKCQTLAKVRWVQARLQDLLPVAYFHGVFTLPHDLNAWARGNPRQLYGLLFQSASAILQAFGRDPKWLGGELGITMVLHTWSQTLEHHIHVHCVVTGGALAPSHDQWQARRNPIGACHRQEDSPKGAPARFGWRDRTQAVELTTRPRKPFRTSLLS